MENIVVNNNDRPGRKLPPSKFYKDIGFNSKKSGDAFLKRYNISIKISRGKYKTYREIKRNQSYWVVIGCK